MSYTNEVFNILNDELRSTDTTAEMLLPILQEIVKIGSCYDRELLCEKLTVDARIFCMNVNR